MYEVIEFIEKEGKENVRFFVPMRKIERKYEFPSLGFAVNSYGREDEIQECIITENPKETRYKIKDNYKISLKSVNDGRIEHYYISDLNSLIFFSKTIKMEAVPAFLKD